MSTLLVTMAPWHKKLCVKIRLVRNESLKNYFPRVIIFDVVRGKPVLILSSAVYCFEKTHNLK